MELFELIETIAEGGVVILGLELDITQLLMSYFDEFASEEYEYEVINQMVKFRG